jgi:D-3-phosphoglycerate dehydrogenase / 2-oxoglutarate reductase
MDILISEDLDAPALNRLERTYIIAREPQLWKDPSRLKDRIAAARTIIIRNQTRLTDDVLACAPKLLAIGRVGVGLDNIDVSAATDRGIVVIAPLDANATSVAELTVAFILTLARKLPAADRSTKHGGWERKQFTGIELAGKTVAICGFGRIGRLVAARARAFGMRIVVFDPYVKPGDPAVEETEAEVCEEIVRAVSEADFVTAHSPLTPQTANMFNAQIFQAMKSSAFFINTSRGGVVEEAALIDALQNGRLAGAALDVRAQEPPLRSPFESMENVILTPHIASFTVEAQTRTFEAVAADIDGILRGEPALKFVNIPKPNR